VKAQLPDTCWAFEQKFISMECTIRAQMAGDDRLGFIRIKSGLGGVDNAQALSVGSVTATCKTLATLLCLDGSIVAGTLAISKVKFCVLD